MADDFDWTEFEGDRFSFEKIGDNIAGRVRDITVKSGSGGRYPVLSLQLDQAGNMREVGCSATDLKAQLAAIDVQRGWWVDITFSAERQTGQPSPMKLFDIKATPPKKAQQPEHSDEEF